MKQKTFNYRFVTFSPNYYFRFRRGGLLPDSNQRSSLLITNLKFELFTVSFNVT
ncbi:hypothetical protein OIU79_011334 [Salix purpurea]|uniref:Uncharacterized protein n=1 Tax=Salix purpurea TaxID=77065 RepID=A0A9Q0T1Q4_SALPP|nr:hypothetical protein OIU79_011334 [Salix purpurea]